MSVLRVRDVERAIANAYPLERAEDWDRCGLLAGDPDAPVTGVALALDANPASVREAVALRANVLVTHHPAYLTPPSWLVPGRGPAGTVFEALSSGVALINAHTNLDRDADAQRLIPDMLGLSPVKPLERSLQPMSVVTVFAPADAVDRIVDAMAGAGAGRIGDYERCSFTAQGQGGFTARANSHPKVGRAGERTSAPEVRVEMVCAERSATGVVSAAAAAHPYEEPLIVVEAARIARNGARLGMVSAAQAGTTLQSLVRTCAEEFGSAVRVWGDPAAEISRVATATGSAGSLVAEAVSSRCDALVAGEVRYHDALSALEGGVAVVELGHDASEWPLVGLLERVVRSIEGLEHDAVRMLPADLGWWIHS